MKSPSIGGEKEGLLEEQANENAPVKKQGILERGDLLKYGSLGFLILQNSSHVLLLRYSRVVGGECSQYVVSVATCPAGRRRSAVVARLHSPHPAAAAILSASERGTPSAAQTSVAVLFSELFKIVFCLIVLVFVEKGPLSALSRLDLDIWQVLA